MGNSAMLNTKLAKDLRPADPIPRGHVISSTMTHPTTRNGEARYTIWFWQDGRVFSVDAHATMKFEILPH